MKTNTNILKHLARVLTLVAMLVCAGWTVAQETDSSDGIDQTGLTAAGEATTDEADTKSDTSPESDDAEEDNDPYKLRSVPEEGQDIGVDSNTGTLLDQDVAFSDSNNRLVRLYDLFDGKRPVMMSFNYSNCPKLCSVQLENMTKTLCDIDFDVNKDFQFVSISIDPTEQSSRARQSKEKYVHMYDRPDEESSDGWHFLTGDLEAIQKVTNQCGFRYKYVREQRLYSHPPVFILLSPNGKIVRYIHGIDYNPRTIELALIEAAEGKIGSPINILQYGMGCFTFNDSTGQYTFQAMAIMRIGGLITVIALIIGLVPYWFFKQNKNKLAVVPTHNNLLET